MFDVRPDRRPQGRKKLAAERRRYFDLVNSGVGTNEACRIVGINYATGYKWRRAAGSRPGPVTQAVSPAPAMPGASAGESSRYLTLADRLVIADLVRLKRSQAEIARELGRPRSTISREIRRNSHPLTGDYRPYAAQDRADARRPRPKTGKIAASPHLRAAVQTLLDDKYSPEQISRRLRRDHPDQPELHVTHETIYQAIYLQARGELRREVASALRTGRTVRTPRRDPAQRQPRFHEPMLMISDRPAEAEDRAVPGHWEGDLIIGKDNASAIGTLVERATRFVVLLHLPDGRTAEHVRDALITAITALPERLRESLTWDQGSEMAQHHEFTIATGMPVYFCDPRSPWQRGSNENTNGLLRQYFPKGTDLSVHTAEHLNAVAAQLNRRPRKTLGWDTPAERVTTLLTQAS
ncbi:IS30 family transposase [Lentzea aerocolonigenes]|uniref:IS30 family transposase n=3 Tax=Lentzea aerocolonigenes TaxID=68170 RepID=UPI001B802479|nr:Transposase and inactivated derivatives, IS30 family [Lentzea aerocolonigenes]MCP2244352.1 Transposase and inactivated derivatives, IS30 family [Lentzea aerocolonigenes]MCP2247766.1 Transposase and inactivated derivatives, IS30 family [Lentzea aerocolonigenes]MCP2249965.1 Transposase and inactivated derivatives, IS30 family [Lentzea aerocolonigenes]